jgi:hypothetical protein
MTDTPVPATRTQQPARWLEQLRNLRVLEWSAGSGILTALLIFLGYVADNGKRAALGIEFLNRPAISPNYIMRGITVIVDFGTNPKFVVFLGATTIIYVLITEYGIKKQSATFQSRMGNIIKHESSSWAVAVAAIAALHYGQSIEQDVRSDIDCTILKPAQEIGAVLAKLGFKTEFRPQSDFSWRLVSATNNLRRSQLVDN